MANPAASRPQDGDGPQEHRLDPPPPLRQDDEGDHARQRDQQHRKVDGPVMIGRDPRLDDGGGDDQEEGRHQDVQREDPEVQAQQLTIPQHPEELIGYRLRVPVDRASVRVGHHQPEDQDTPEGQECGGPEDSREPPDPRDGRPQDQGESEGETDADPDPRHGPGAHLVPGQVRGECGDRRGDRPRPLDHPPQDHPLDAGGERRDQTPQDEDEEPAIDHGLAPDPVREHAEGDLEYRLGEPIGPDGDPDEERCGPREVVGIECEHGQDQEEAQHPQAIDTRETGGGAALAGGQGWDRRL